MSFVYSPIPREKPKVLVCWRCGYNATVWSPTVGGALKCPATDASGRKCLGHLHLLSEPR